MTRLFSLITLCALLLTTGTGCFKECKPKSVSSESSTLLAYASSIGMVATAHESGVYYEILDGGTGVNPTVTSNVAVTYVGKFMNGEKFDEATEPNNTASNPHWSLASLIEGWRIGLPLIKEGGKIRLLIPSKLAYGCDGRASIPGNAPLFFEISLVDVQ